MNPLGLEPRIFGLKVRCISHYAKGPVCLYKDTPHAYPKGSLDLYRCIHGETLVSLLPAGNHLFSPLAQVPVRGCSYTQGATACSSNNKKPRFYPGSLLSSCAQSVTSECKAPCAWLVDITIHCVLLQYGCRANPWCLCFSLSFIYTGRISSCQLLSLISCKIFFFSL